MAIRFTTVRCGGCNTAWTWGDTQGDRSICGPPIIKCRTCGTLNKTGRVLWREASTFTKARVYASSTFSVIFMGLGSAAIGLYGLFEGLEEFWKIMAILPLWFSYVTIKDYIDVIKGNPQADNDALYDKNGGFHWSDEQY